MFAEGLWTIQFAETEEQHGGLQVIEEINRGVSIVLVNGKGQPAKENSCV